MYVCVDDLFIGVNKEIKYILIDFFEHFAFLFLYFYRNKGVKKWNHRH